MHSRWYATLGLVVALSGCGPGQNDSADMTSLVFLTREGCANTALLRASLDDALRAMHLPVDYQVIDLATLPATDVRSGYPTPALLYRGRDVFGLAVPLPPYGVPT